LRPGVRRFSSSLIAVTACQKGSRQASARALFAFDHHLEPIIVAIFVKYPVQCEDAGNGPREPGAKSAIVAHCPSAFWYSMVNSVVISLLR
jgi:hypothetical protein